MALRTYRKQRNIYLQNFTKATLVSHKTHPPYLQPPPPHQLSMTGLYSRKWQLRTQSCHMPGSQAQGTCSLQEGLEATPAQCCRNHSRQAESRERRHTVYQIHIRFKVTNRSNIKGLNYAHRNRKNSNDHITVKIGIKKLLKYFTIKQYCKFYIKMI